MVFRKTTAAYIEPPIWKPGKMLKHGSRWRWVQMTVEELTKARARLIAIPESRELATKNAEAMLEAGLVV